MKKFYKESDINGLYMKIRHEAFKREDKLVSIDFIFDKFESFKKEKVTRLEK